MCKQFVAHARTIVPFNKMKIKQEKTYTDRLTLSAQLNQLLYTIDEWHKMKQKNIVFNLSYLKSSR